MKKLHLKQIFALIGAFFALLFLVGYLLFSGNLSSWSDWDKFDKFTTDDGHYSVIINVSSPLVSSGKVMRFKIICKDEIYDKEKEIRECKLVVSLKNDKPLFKFNELNQRKSELIINDSNNKKIDLIWSDIFS